MGLDRCGHCNHVRRAAAIRLNHPNIVDPITLIEQDHVTAMLMPRIIARDLGTLDADANPLRTLKYYREKGMLRASMVGRHLLYRRVELDRFLDLQTTGNSQNSNRRR
jgi:hypothetical protein